MKHSHHSHHSDYSHHSPQGNSAYGHPSAPEAKPAQDEVARKAYEIYLKEGCPQGRDVQHWLQAESRMHG